MCIRVVALLEQGGWLSILCPATASLRLGDRAQIAQCKAADVQLTDQERNMNAGLLYGAVVLRLASIAIIPSLSKMTAVAAVLSSISIFCAALLYSRRRWEKSTVKLLLPTTMIALRSLFLALAPLLIGGMDFISLVVPPAISLSRTQQPTVLPSQVLQLMSAEN